MSKGDFIIKIEEKDLTVLREIVKAMGEIDGSKAIMNSLSSGMALITRKGKSNLTNNKTGNLKRSIRRKQVKKWISVYGGFKKGKGGGNHAHLVDRGTKKRYTSKGYYRGTVSKQGAYTGSQFWTKAVLSEGPKMMNKTMKTIDKELLKITRKKIKK